MSGARVPAERGGPASVEAREAAFLSYARVYWMSAPERRGAVYTACEVAWEAYARQLAARYRGDGGPGHARPAPPGGQGTGVRRPAGRG